MTLDKREYYISLYLTYGKLLTEKQRNYFEDYYLYDLSLAEIAENNKVSRNAIYDTLNKTIALLEQYENILAIVKKKEQTSKLLDDSALAKAIAEIWEE